MTICTYISYCAFVTLYLYIGTLRTMNASTWKKAADIVAKTTSVTPQASATPRATDNSEIPTEAYCQILPGMTSQLYPTLVADSLLEAHMSDQQDTLQMQLSTEVDKYLQEVAAK